MLVDETTLLEIINDELTAGIVNLELPTTTIRRNLKRALMLSSDYFNYSTFKTVNVNKTGASGGYINLSELDEDNMIPKVIKVYPATQTVATQTGLLGLSSSFIISSSGLDERLTKYASLVSKLSTVESILGRSAKIVGDKLYLDNYYDKVTIEYIPNVVKVEHINEGAWIRWLIEYTVALCKRQLGQSRGKFVVNSNQFTTNAAELLNESTEVITRLEEELQNKGVLLASRWEEMNNRKIKRVMWYVLSLTWGLPYTVIGFFIWLGLLIGYRKHIIQVKITEGRLLLHLDNETPWGGISLGMCYAVGGNFLHTFQHELGHTIQSAVLGILFPFVIALPSLIRASLWHRIQTRRRRKGLPYRDYDSIWFEGQATRLGQKYFEDLKVY